MNKSEAGSCYSESQKHRAIEEKRQQNGSTRQSPHISIDSDRAPSNETASLFQTGGSFLGIHWCWSATSCIITMILILGIASSTTFLWVGISGAQKREEDHFQRDAGDLIRRLKSQFDQYVTAASYVHSYCRDRSFTREEFRFLYEYLIDDGLDFKAVQFDPNITRDEREQFEAEAKAYYAEFYPHVNYRGFVGFETEIPTMLEPRSPQDFYFPIHFMEPIVGNEAAIDLDYYSHISRRQTLEFCMGQGEPGLTDRLVLVKDPDVVSRCGAIDPAYGVVLMHPGVMLQNSNETWPRDLSSIVICIPDLLGNTVESGGNALEGTRIYIYDASDSSGAPAVYLGAILAHDFDDVEFLPEKTPDSLRENDLVIDELIAVTPNKNWSIVVVGSTSTYRPDITFVILGGVVIIVAAICVAFWVYHSAIRIRKFNDLRSSNEAEKANLILENAREAAKAERELNDFIAHEVRNPVSAAMTACSFVKSALKKPESLRDEETLKVAQEDVQVIDHSLNFVGDLLRNMLDMHRAADKKLKINLSPSDLLYDIFLPTAGMLYRRGDSKVKVLTECPSDLFVETDPLRLKQVVLNLGRNSVKFISQGFIRLRAQVVDGTVEISVEDSGSGVPVEKRALLFNKFQDSLDVLSQGTGIGLFLCKNLVELMGGEISLDENYDSGVPGFPGARFVVRLNKPPCVAPDLEARRLSDSNFNLVPSTGEDESVVATVNADEQSQSDHYSLPEKLEVLFVDDDSMLRKLFARSIKRVAPSWTFHEAGNGEAALVMTESKHFDIIFMDMYMASVEKQLLGTETVVELRGRGIQSKIVGLSANDKEEEFLAAGADAFIFKPIPCKKDLLRAELGRLLYSGPSDEAS